ncbi:DUF5132 domain-containing protein [Streptomyces adustus]|uniref:DUF5132 domain-containing protein n=1 Tax=Streptomyces adustus TaxID=1609272 RepID=A0A5N8V7Y3_9ACTN|nr:DUF5132 domain-containing protein [Streptomyces adustus]MPY31199.1 DUF5132 domain-containing protein [Streptomyces adustus]
MPPVVPPFLIGLITASLVKRLGKPLMRGLVKTSVGLGIEVKRAVQEAGEGIQDLAVEATAEALAVRTAEGAEHGVGAPEEGAAGRVAAAANSTPAAAAANEGQSGGEGKPAGKNRSGGSVATKVR